MVDLGAGGGTRERIPRVAALVASAYSALLRYSALPDEVPAVDVRSIRDRKSPARGSP